MDPPLLLAGGFFLVLFVVLLPYMRDQYEEQYDGEQEYFRENNPRVWNIIEGAERRGEKSEDLPDGHCPACGAQNDPEFTLCRRCNRPLPSRDED